MSAIFISDENFANLRLFPRNFGKPVRALVLAGAGYFHQGATGVLNRGLWKSRTRLSPIPEVAAPSEGCCRCMDSWLLMSKLVRWASTVASTIFNPQKRIKKRME